MENNNLTQQNEQVTEPIVTEPVLTEPVVTEAVVTEAVVEETVVEEAVVAEAAVEEVKAEEPAPAVEAPVVAAAAAPVVYAQQPAYTQQPVYAQPVYAQPQAQPAKPSRGKGLALSIVSLVLGLFGFIFALITAFMTFTVFLTSAYSYGYDVESVAAVLAIVIVYGLIVIGCSIPAIILGAKGKKLIGSKMGTAGVVFSIINFVLIGLSVVMTIIMMGAIV